MIDISVQNIKKAFEEGNDILDGITFDVNEGERVGLLGKNGAGKTTLLKIITGELSEDEGEIVMPDFKKVGLISQIPEFPEHFTGEDVLRTAFAELYGMKAEMEKLEKQMSDTTFDATSSATSTEVLNRYDRLSHEFERLGGYTIETDLARVVNGLMIPDTQRKQRFSSLSGGEKTRLNLARLILENTDILLLDEPTNHLDLNATIWLEDFLIKFKGTALIISHDRYFLDKTINRVVEISNGKAEFYSGNYSYYTAEKKMRYEQQLERFEREKAEAKRLNESADRLQQWGFGNKRLMKKSFALRTRAERVLKTEKPDRDKTMRAGVSSREFRGDEVLLVKGLSKSFGEKRLFEIDELLVKGAERIAIIGDNGTGKTTLIKVLLGELQPDSGFSRRGPAVKPAYLPQIIHFDNPNRSILDTLIYEKDCSPQVARNRLGAFLFSGEDVFKHVGDLSGGEKSRLRLCMLTQDEINLLILDEPTNHLDLASREWIEGIIEEYDETLIFISHDRYFIDRFATRIWELSDGGFTDFGGTYSKYIDMKNALRTTQESKASKGNNERREGSAPKEKAKKRKVKPSDAQKEQRRLEREISKLEVDIDDVTRQKEQHASDYEKLMELDAKEQELNVKLEQLMTEWEEAAG